MPPLKGLRSLANVTQGLTTPTCAKAAQVGVARPGLLYFRAVQISGGPEIAVLILLGQTSP